MVYRISGGKIMNVTEKLLQSFDKVKNLYSEDELMSDLLPALKQESLGHKKTYENACEHLESINTLPHMISDIASFILGWCHGNEFIEQKLNSGELSIGEIMDALYVCILLVEDQYE
jgi:hypothetical protein